MDKYINVNGVRRLMTPEEIAEREAWEREHPAPGPTREEQMQADIDFIAVMAGVTL